MATAADKEAQALGRAIPIAAAPDRIAALPALVRGALEREWEERRFFLWLPVFAGAGVSLYFAADREPSLPYAAAIEATMWALGLSAATR